MLITFLSPKFAEQKMVQILTSHVFFHLTTVAHQIASVLHRIILNHGAQLRLMQMEIMNLEYMENGETVTVTVITHPATAEQVIQGIPGYTVLISVSSFFGRIVGLKKRLRLCLTFNFAKRDFFH